MNNRITICLASSRSYAKLARVIITLNELLYEADIFAEDRIELNDVYDKEGALTHFEITGSPLDFFQIGLRYGRLEEKESLDPYLQDFYKDAVSKPLETSAL
jgi:hypothetical protein